MDYLGVIKLKLLIPTFKVYDSVGMGLDLIVYLILNTALWGPHFEDCCSWGIPAMDSCWSGKSQSLTNTNYSEEYEDCMLFEG